MCAAGNRRSTRPAGAARATPLGARTGARGRLSRDWFGAARQRLERSEDAAALVAHKAREAPWTRSFSVNTR